MPQTNGLLFEGSFASFFLDKKSKRSHKTIGIMFFLLFLLDDRRIRIRIHEAQKHTDFTDPDLGPGSATLLKTYGTFSSCRTYIVLSLPFAFR
jgi:hypothetical protein